MRIKKTSATRPDQAIEVRYYGFINELEMLCNRYGVALQVAGGVQYFDPTMERVKYDRDFLSGDLKPRVGRK